MATPKASRIPPLIYGTAWKKDKTSGLVTQALLCGFRAVDTAAQPKHYQEHLVGQGIRDAMSEGKIKREELYIQTKFTAPQGHDLKNMPYDPRSPISEQVSTSVKSSLHNLRPNDNSEPYLDCLVLHSPLPSLAQTQQAWQAMETHVPHHTRTLGLSNCYQLPLLRAIYDSAAIKPSVLQNRFYAESGFDSEIRAFCKEKGVRYQSFWTLTANPRLLKSPAVGNVAEKVGVSRPVALYGLVLGLGETSVLCGTTDQSRMAEDLAGVEKVQKWSEKETQQWKEVQGAFQALLDG